MPDSNIVVSWYGVRHDGVAVVSTRSPITALFVKITYKAVETSSMRIKKYLIGAF